MDNETNPDILGWRDWKNKQGKKADIELPKTSKLKPDLHRGHVRRRIEDIQDQSKIDRGEY